MVQGMQTIVYRLLYESSSKALLQHKRMPVHTGHQTQSYRSPYGLCDLALVLGPQTSISRVLDTSRLGHVFRHHGEVLPSISLLPACTARVHQIPCTPTQG